MSVIDRDGGLSEGVSYVLRASYCVKPKKAQQDQNKWVVGQQRNSNEGGAPALWAVQSSWKAPRIEAGFHEAVVGQILADTGSRASGREGSAERR